jgi:two-component system phosphate regulon sensor histidine kinase PhoR
MTADPEPHDAFEEAPAPAEPIERIILRSMSEGVMTLECNGRIFSVNPASEAILGVSGADLIGRSMQEAFSSNPRNREFLEVFLDVVSHGSRTMRREIRFYRNDGQVLDLLVAASFLDLAECRPFAENVVAVFRDITPFKALEKVRRKAADHLSHEMKTPLAVIGASLETAVEGAPDTPNRRRALQRIRRGLRRLSDLQEITEQMLNPSDYSPRKLDLAAWVRDVLVEIRKSCAHRRVFWETDIPPELRATVNPDLVKTALCTPVKNAVENTPDESVIRVSAGEDGGRPYIEVADRGVGIPPVDLQFIFEGFHHTQDTEDYSSKHPYDFNAGGKGLELLRLKVLSEAGHFDIRCESRRCAHIPDGRDLCPGAVSLCPHVKDRQGCLDSGGTVFRITFPLLGE